MIKLLRNLFCKTFGLVEAVAVMDENENLTRREAKVGQSFVQAVGIKSTVAEDIASKQEEISSMKSNAGKTIQLAEQLSDKANKAYQTKEEEAGAEYNRAIDRAAIKRDEKIDRADKEFQQLAQSAADQIRSAKATLAAMDAKLSKLNAVKELFVD